MSGDAKGWLLMHSDPNQVRLMGAGFVLAYPGVGNEWCVKPEDYPPLRRAEPPQIANLSTVRELQDEVAAFADEAFGPDREQAAWMKLFEEIGETLKNPDDPEEWADIFIILLDLATMHGVNVDGATRSKLDKIKDRVWVQTSTGTFQHVPGAVQAPPGPEYTALFEGGPLGQDGPLRLGGQPLQLYTPVGHEGVGIYKQTRIDHGIGRRLIHVYRWDPDYPEVF